MKEDTIFYGAPIPLFSTFLTHFNLKHFAKKREKKQLIKGNFSSLYYNTKMYWPQLKIKIKRDWTTRTNRWTTTTDP